MSYAVFLGCFLRLEDAVGRGESPKALEGLFAMLVVLAMVQNLAAVRFFLSFHSLSIVLKGTDPSVRRLACRLRWRGTGLRVSLLETAQT